VKEFHNGDLVFDVGDEGPVDGEVVILLHGFPETREAWDGVVPGLADAGYRVLAPNQRGYARGARPTGRRAYVADNLVADVLALADAAGADRFHLVGHDWGGAVAWYCAMWHPRRLRTMTSLATPHPTAFARSLVVSAQLIRSLYFLLFQLPALPEWLTSSTSGRRRFRKTLIASGLQPEKVDAYLAVLDEPGAMTAALNWYRAVPFTPASRQGSVRVPTMYVYATRDFALGSKAADLTGRYVSGPYRYERLDVTHWIPEQVPDIVTRLILEHVSASSVM